MGKESGKQTSLFRDMQFPLSSELVGVGERSAERGTAGQQRRQIRWRWSIAIS